VIVAIHARKSTNQQVPDEEDVTVFEPSEEGDGYLVCRPAVSPETVDILNVYRPPDELPSLARLAVGLGAKALWLQPGSTSSEARDIAAAGGLAFIEGVDIAEAVRSSGIPLR